VQRHVHWGENVTSVFEPVNDNPPELETARDSNDDYSMEAVLRIARLIAAVLAPQSDIGGDTTPEQVQEWLEEAKVKIGLDVVYDDATMEGMNLREFNTTHWERNDMKLRTEPIEEIVRQAISPLLLKGESADELRVSLKNVTNRHKVIDILSNGQRKWMINSYRPDGGRERSFGRSYLDKRRICNNALVKLVEQGRALAFTEDAMRSSHQLEKLSTSPLAWAPKTDEPKGRTCLNASKGSKNFPSLNDSIDLESCDNCYPPVILPLLPDIAELVCQRQEQFPGESLSGATVDISAAYNQIAQSVPSAMTHATRLKVIIDFIETVVVVIYLVGMFGFSRMGNIYCQCAQAIDEVHNMGLTTKRSLTYIDDGILIDPHRLIEQSVAEYISPAIKLFGTDGVINMDKVKIWASELQAIGWHFDFETWTVRPKEKGMAKMFHSVFERIPIGANTIDEKQLEIVVGILSWYAVGIPAGRSYLSSLFSCKHRVGQSSRRVVLTAEAKADLTWWRALMVVAYSNPTSLAASISSVRRNRVATLLMRTDASSLTGGGAEVLDIKTGKAFSEYRDDAIRWTGGEIDIFESMGVSINVLEYYVIIYYVMLWGEKLRGHVIHVECDNTSAVSWIVKSRAGHSPAADALTKLFSLFCLKMNISIICTHIQGVKNIVADFRSRDLTYLAQDADEELAAGNLQLAGTRQELCRRLLKISVTKPEDLHGPKALAILMTLR
jgi:hypothetical protein